MTMGRSSCTTGRPKISNSSATKTTWKHDYGQIIFASNPFAVYARRSADAIDPNCISRCASRQEAEQLNLGVTEHEYNVHRWYCGGWRRYSQADPMGLAAGPNVFAYALGDPIELSDRLGLVAEILCKNIGTGGHKIPGAYHCRVHVSCSRCNNGGFPESDSTYGMEYTGHPPYSINEWAYPSGIGPDYTIRAPITHPGMSDCQFAKCVSANNKVFQRGYTGKTTGKVPAYHILGPNSNTYAHRLVDTCGGTTDFPYGAVGSNDDPWPPFK